MERFSIGHGRGGDWHAAVDACLDQLTAIPEDANLGFLYVTDEIAGDLGKITASLIQHTGIGDWIGTTGIGICATGREYFGEAAVAAMVAGFPEDSFTLFDGMEDGVEAFVAKHGVWLGRSPAHFAVIHGDPRHPQTSGLIPDLADAADCFLVGGLASSRGDYPQIAGRLSDGAVSGIMFDAEIPVVTALTQGCTPIGKSHTVTYCQDNIAVMLDGRPALEVFKEDIGEVLAHDLNRISGYIFVGFPIAGSDRADYTVRNLVGLDVERQLIAVGAPLSEGQEIIFCRRDRASARTDLERMLADLKRRAGGPAKGALYFTCLGRGPNMFGDDESELDIIRRELGDIPLIGFFGNGEISHNRLYGYTGVLTLFL